MKILKNRYLGKFLLPTYLFLLTHVGESWRHQSAECRRKIAALLHTGSYHKSYTPLPLFVTA